jgi:hypothetical protein
MVGAPFGTPRRRRNRSGPVSFFWWVEVNLCACLDWKRRESGGVSRRIVLDDQPPGETTPKELGFRFILNKSGKLLLTAKGEQYFDAIRTPIRGILQATDAIRYMPGRRRVLLTLTPCFAAASLLLLLQDFKTKHPGVELDLIAITRVVDLDRENVDLATRRGAAAGLLMWQIR